MGIHRINSQLQNICQDSYLWESDETATLDFRLDVLGTREQHSSAEIERRWDVEKSEWELTEIRNLVFRFPPFEIDSTEKRNIERQIDTIFREICDTKYFIHIDSDGTYYRPHTTLSLSEVEKLPQLVKNIQQEWNVRNSLSPALDCEYII